MVIIRRACVVVIAAIFAASCATVRQGEQASRPADLLYIDGAVQALSGQEAVITLKLPEFRKTTELPVNEIAQQVVQKSLFIEGILIEINGVPAVIKEIRGNTVSVVLERPQGFGAGTGVKLRVPKKTIAVKDFEVIRGNQKEAGVVTLEGLTTALIDSGHFIVVERTKLKTILEEIALSQTGLTQEKPGTMTGKLLSADLILTGTLAEIEGKWEINLRLVNVITGQALSAIFMRTALLSPSAIRDAGPLNENFEADSPGASWTIGTRGKGAFTVALDRSQGADGSHHALRLDFTFPSGLGSGGDEIFENMDNRKKRDLSSYTGIEFYARTTTPVAGLLRVLISNRDDPNMIDAWVANFEAGNDWKLVRIPFRELTIGRGWIKGGARKFGAKPGSQIMDMSHVESIGIGVHGNHNPRVKGSMWIDDVRFYAE